MPEDQRKDQKGRRRANQKDVEAAGLRSNSRVCVGDADRPSADIVRQSVDAEGLGAAQRLFGLTLSLEEALEDFCGYLCWVSQLTP